MTGVRANEVDRFLAREADAQFERFVVQRVADVRAGCAEYSKDGRPPLHWEQTPKGQAIARLMEGG